jgi:tetratricopeptide (TPR) repeat protein
VLHSSAWSDERATALTPTHEGRARRRSPRGAAPVGTLARFQPSTTPPPRGALILLSAALIVRDEGAFLDGCLASLRGLVDEIVVVDTGSVDDTVAVAHAHRAVVDEIDWCDDFSAARNHSLDLASGEWVLHVDADERVRAGAHDAARDAIAAAAGSVALLVRFVPRAGWTPSRALRLWRNVDSLRFEGTVHESIVPAARAAGRRHGLRLEPFDLLTIEHLSFAGDAARQRARDEPLLLAALAADPGRASLYGHLARIYEGIGDSERAVATWQRGIDVARSRGARHPDDRRNYVDLLFHLLARERVDDEFGAIVAEAERVLPRLPTVELAAARYEFAVGRPRDAIGRLEWLVDRDLDTMIDTGMSYDARVFGEWAWDLLGLCRFQLGDDDGAAVAFRHAEMAAPDVAAYAVRRRLAEARGGSGSSPAS